MADTFPIGPIAPVKIPFDVVNYDFQTLAAGDGDNVPNLLDQIDADLAVFAASIEAQIILGSVLDSGIFDLLSGGDGIGFNDPSTLDFLTSTVTDGVEFWFNDLLGKWDSANIALPVPVIPLPPAPVPIGGAGGDFGHSNTN